MRIADHPKKIGLLLLPLIPLTAIGIAHVVDRLSGSSETCTCTAAPPVVERIETPPAPPPMPDHETRPAPPA